MRNAGAFKGMTDGKPEGGKAPQAATFKLKKEQEREEAIRRGEERSRLNKEGDRT